MGKLDANVAGQLIEGVARGCRNNGCALIGGETAEMPGLYQKGEYDLAGFIVGGVERRRMLTGAGIRPGDVLLGLPSNGLHTNGYSLARKLLFETARQAAHEGAGGRAPEGASQLLEADPRVDRRALAEGRGSHYRRGDHGQHASHSAVGLAARVDVSSWTVPPLFEELRAIGKLDLADYRRTFNLGVGMILVLAKRNLGKARAILSSMGEACFQMGDVVESRGPRVVYSGGGGEVGDR